MKFFIVDAFTETQFGGNPAGVMILDEGADFPSEDFMVKAAAELRYSETAFIKQLSPEEFQIRYFTPAAEVDLCGHATIGSFAALHHAGIIQDDKSYINHTLAGRLNINLRNGIVMMDMAAPRFIDKIQDTGALAELYDIMGIPLEIVTARTSEGVSVNLLPNMVSTGLPDIIMPVKDRETLARVSPDFDKLSALSEKYQVVGVHVFTLASEIPDVTAFCRNFAPLYEIDEEAATGTSNGALAYYLFAHDLLGNKNELSFIQGEAMNRPSKVLSTFQNQGNEIRIQVGGSAVILAKGDFLDI